MKEKKDNQNVESHIGTDTQVKPRVKFFKKHKKKLIIGVILLILVIGGGMVYASQTNGSAPVDYSPPYVSKTSLKAEILQVYDGDQTINPQISIYNRVVKVKLKLEADYDIHLANKEQVSLVSHGKNYYPIQFENIALVSRQPFEKDFYFELERDYKPELIVIQDDDLYNNLEIAIDVEADYYSINPDLKLVFDDETNAEYLNFKGKLEKLVAGDPKLEENNLPNIDLKISLPENKTISLIRYRDIEEEYQGDGDYYGPPCFEIDKESLEPTSKNTKCQSYNIDYDVYSDNKFIGVSRNFEIYYNSYPSDLVGVLNSHSDLNKSTISLLGKEVTLNQVITSSDESYFTLIKVDEDNIYIIETSKYLPYSQQLPIEIYNLEKELMFKVFMSLKYEKQEDIVEVTPIEGDENTEPETTLQPTITPSN